MPLTKLNDGKNDSEQTVTAIAKEKISGDLELQIFVGGFGDEFWKLTIDDFN